MLIPGDKFPNIALDLVGSGTVSLPAQIQDSWAYILFYRGGW